MKISIIGTGYVGLVTGVCLASKGHEVICIDKKQEVVDKINNMDSPIYEQGLEELMIKGITAGNLVATTDLESSVVNSEISIIAVGTPIDNDEIDLSYIKKAAQDIGEILRDKNHYHVVCVKSTVIPTTTDTLVKDILEGASGKKIGEIGLAMNPEFLREGKAVEDFMYPDRIVIGAYDHRSFEAMKHVYDGFFHAPIIHVNLRTAEMIKYTANALLATLISFSNEIASICEKTKNIDITEVLESVTLDKRFNPRIDNKLVNPEMNNYLRAGCGFGGSCFPKDVKALISYSQDIGYQPRIIDATIKVNNEQPIKIINRLQESLQTLKDKKIALLGLAFKPDTDDIRESPSITIINRLLEKGALVYGVDPIAVENMKKNIPEDRKSMFYSTDYKSALTDADAAILVTSWSEFIDIPPEDFSQLMKRPILLDGRRGLNKRALEDAGVVYIGIGLA
ncbi:UDP-glucose dehydrogenase family protein [Natronincola ferrireducens]|uniref:UDP-glucose 6-dehydrogenase n=1 Tax=Natronincola ferrireducens TaxID=393762 RepID=A0A1G9CRS7_9FIRM|nr:UDP-glucose/GDP-mannose dehydrogenase family protein [Natronincola ferrireducens]SDK54326.1 GDP-mannose 6-dehydrogenase [Natronincola ferrireducens]